MFRFTINYPALIAIALSLPGAPVNGQLYTNASNALPAAAAMRNSMDVRAADLDGDGDLDLVKANEFQGNTILLNDGAGVFTAAAPGALPQIVNDSEDVAVADFNGDGHLDLVFCSEDDVVLGQSDVHEYYLGDGAGHFAAAGYQPPDSEANAVIAADLNNDGHPDLVFGNKGTCTVLINDGAGSFTAENDRVPAIVKTTQDIGLADVDLDGDADLLLGNEDGNLLFINDGAGYFSDGSPTRLPQGVDMETRKVTFGDVDADGDPDVFLSNVDFTPAGEVRQNRLYLNDGQGFFTDVTATHLPADNDHTVDAVFDDVDLDGDLDLIVSNVFGGPVRVYANDGGGVFSDMTQAVLGQSYFLDGLGVIATDLNGDGLNDLYFCHRNNPNNPNKDLYLLRNPVSSVGAPGFPVAISLYPNPVHDRLFVRYPASELDSLVLVATDGTIIGRLPLVEKGDSVWCAALPPSLRPGTYRVELYGRDGTRVARMVVRN